MDHYTSQIPSCFRAGPVPCEDLMRAPLHSCSFALTLVLLAACNSTAPGPTSATTGRDATPRLYSSAPVLRAQAGNFLITDLTGGVSPADLANALVGAGVLVSDINYTGAGIAAGTFTGGSGIIDFDSGVVLSSGRAKDIQGPNSSGNKSTSLGTAGDAALSSLAGKPTYDAAILSFNFKADADKVYFQYVFGSEEYDEYAGSQYNDVFGFYINGQNCATVGPSAQPVSINTINLSTNPSLYIKNNSPSTLNTQMDGLTVTLTCAVTVTPNAVNTMTLKIADASDTILDSVVLLKTGSFSTTPPINLPPVAKAGGPYSGPEGSPIILDASGSSDPNADTLTYEWDLDNDGTYDVSGAQYTLTPADNGASTVGLKVTDSSGASSTDTATVTVSNVNPVVGALSVTPATPVAVGSSVSLSTTFTDPSSADTHTAQVSWGDGATSSSNIPAAGPRAVNAGHAYTTPGIYTVTTTVTDDDGGVGTSSYEYVVVYDPAGGFVTGGGTIQSPLGAYMADPALTGKATFGFVSKYQKGATVPTGNTEFQFHAGNFNFKSAAYEWLTIAGARAQYKGTGTVNGAGSYGFLLTAVDGQVSGGGGTDKFRLKVWDRTTNATVYDNQVGASDTATPSTPLAGGSIVIHSK
ncbi:PKD domain-containing protein (plasmid) [Deinococcus taeanensis]|uniref:choice-of-anchor L domain-containing protein n=1 Tax=Deinococcus taeanensis TaxID=2737050 RepID=UPI001CDC4877|nr:choice-of-anchor L domain-containing protein [Deinococcus taeanensis]UBV44766.1 PKD domain-containing protein [Deinococcus taeanensis]